MAIVDVDCSECGVILQIDDARMGSTMECPKCRSPFVVEPAGAYDLAAPPPKTSGRPPRAPAAPALAESPETDDQRRLREQMERWADDS
jgi:hypothetical protein